MYSKLITDPKELTLIKVIGQGSFGVVHLVSWRGSLVAAKVIPVSQAELRKYVVRREIDILRLFCKAINYLFRYHYTNLTFVRASVRPCVRAGGDWKPFDPS